MSSDLFLALGNVFATGDLVRLIVMFAIVGVAGWIMPNLNAIFTTTFISLLVFAVASVVTTAVLAGNQAVGAIEEDWSRLFGLNMLTLVAYILSFAVMIAGVHTLRNIMLRT